jgi:hypothetical protein
MGLITQNILLAFQKKRKKKISVILKERVPLFYLITLSQSYYYPEIII